MRLPRVVCPSWVSSTVLDSATRLGMPSRLAMRQAATLRWDSGRPCAMHACLQAVSSASGLRMVVAMRKAVARCSIFCSSGQAVSNGANDCCAAGSCIFCVKTASWDGSRSSREMPAGPSRSPIMGRKALKIYSESTGWIFWNAGSFRCSSMYCRQTDSAESVAGGAFSSGLK